MKTIIKLEMRYTSTLKKKQEQLQKQIGALLMAGKKCIDPARVPCEKAREYMKKRGLLCEELTPPRPKPKKRGWFKEWFG